MPVLQLPMRLRAWTFFMLLRNPSPPPFAQTTARFRKIAETTPCVVWTKALPPRALRRHKLGSPHLDSPEAQTKNRRHKQ